MQYSKAISKRYPVFSTSLNCEVDFVEAKCTGIKHCEYLHPKLQGDHDPLSPAWQQSINDVRTELYSGQLNTPLKSNTEVFAAVIRTLFVRPAYACRPMVVN